MLILGFLLYLWVVGMRMYHNHIRHNKFGWMCCTLIISFLMISVFSHEIESWCCFSLSGILFLKNIIILMEMAFFFCVEFFRGYLLSGEICEVPLAMVGFTVGASKFRAFSDVFVSFLHFSFLFCILALHLLLFGFLYAGLWEFGPLAWFLFF